MSKTVKFEDLTEEEQQTVKKAGKKLFLNGLFIGANYGGLLFFSNLVLMMANEAYFKSTVLLFVLCVIVDIKLISMMRQANQENAAEFATTVKQILDNK